MKRGILTNILIGLLALLPLSAMAFSWHDFFENEDDSSEMNSVENNVSVSAGTGGNNASAGSPGGKAGSIVTGSVSTSVKVKTVVSGEEVENIDQDLEADSEDRSLEIRRDYATSGVRVHTNVDIGATATNRDDTLELASTSEEDSSGYTNMDGEDEDIGSTTNASLPESGASEPGRLRGFIREWWSRLFSFFDF